MSIIADKKNGKLNGRWRVELQRKGFKSFRKRFDTFAEAEKAEAAKLAAWDRGEDTEEAAKVPEEPKGHTFLATIEKARGLLWDGQDTEELSFQRLKIAADIIGKDLPMDAIDTHKIDDLVKKLRAEGRSTATINRYLCHLRVFLMWAKTRKYRTAPVEGEDGVAFARKKESKGRIRWITLEEEAAIKDFLLAEERHDDPKEARAVWDLIEVGIATGCRREELLSCKVDQIEGDLLHLWETKTDEARTVPMLPAIRKKLIDLIESGRMPNGVRLRAVWQRLRAHMGLLGDPHFVFHACRHTCATRMVDADVNMFVIQEWMGHKNIITTRRYAHVKPQNLTDALKKVGERRLAALENPSVSAVFHAPHTLPTGGGNGLSASM